MTNSKKQKRRKDKRSCQLYPQGMADLLLFSGGQENNSRYWNKVKHNIADVAMQAGYKSKYYSNKATKLWGKYPFFCVGYAKCSTELENANHQSVKSW